MIRSESYIKSGLTPSVDVFWILTTQWRGQSIGWAGDPNTRTPHLDRAARAGVIIEQAVANHPFGPFSRASILTGRPTDEVGVSDYFDPLPADCPTVAHAFSRAGYETAWFGKWHLGPKLRGPPPVGEVHARQPIPPDRRGGFGWWEGFEGGFLNRDPWLHGSGWREPTQVRGYQSDILVDRLLRYLEARTSESPLFSVLSLEPPHPPYDGLPDDIIIPDPAGIILRENVPVGGEVEQRARREYAAYCGQIEATDRALGRLLDRLEDRDRPYLLVFTSVHGDMHGSLGLFRKGWPHEESIRVPLLFLSPGRLKPAQRADGVFGLIDLGATSLGLIGSQGAPEVGGRDQSGWLRGECAGPTETFIRMPSVPPFPPNCPKAWSGIRGMGRTTVWNSDGSPWLDLDQRGQS
ncbi:MAG: sulfatase-like hydrolase/transferase [Opitutaceae bacterium]